MKVSADQAKMAPLKIVDTTLRDGHQSSFATRMLTDDMDDIAEEMDKAGFHAVEVWGGATFDVSHRFLGEDPWERPRVLKRLMPRTPFQMLLRGQNLVGYRNYADDVVKAFVFHAAEVGIDIFRIFDALNDVRNLATATEAVKECGKHAQLALCYSITESGLGGPVFNIDYYLKKARAMQEMGADSLCVKDMAGLLSPLDAYELIRALKATVKIPIDLHSHFTSGMACMTYLKAVEAGVDMVDTALAPFALRSSQPAVEPIVVSLRGTERDTGLDLAHLQKIGQYLESVAPRYRDFLDTTRMSVIDTNVLLHQIPGGMLTNLVSQLKEAGALDRIDEVYAELPRVRKELGYPPLVTPTSQIVGIQAVLNVLQGRYQIVPAEVQDYVYGLYGQPPVPVDPEVQKTILKGYARGTTPITCRAADILEPEMEKAKEATKGIAKNIGDVLIYALYPTTGMRFLKWKYRLEPMPAELGVKTLADIAREDTLIAKVKAGELVEGMGGAVPPKSTGAGTPSALAEVKVESEGGSPTLSASEPAAATPAVSALHKARAPQAPTGEEVAIVAPMAAMVVRYEVNEGDRVNAGDPVVVIEAMKMQTVMTAPRDGIVKTLPCKPGTLFKKGENLAIIAAR